jgi:hypothetical protein
MIVSYSEIAKRDVCARQYYYRYILDLQPITATIPIATGNKGHKLLQTFYTLLMQGKSIEEAIKIVEAQAVGMIKEKIVTDGSLLTAWTLVHNYMLSYKITSSESLLVENRFQVPASRFSDDPVFEDVMIGFTPDLVTKRMGGFCDVEDAKFVGKAWSDAKLDQYQQLRLYEIFLKEMGYPISRTILRFFNTATGKIVEHKYTTSPIERKIILDDFLVAVKNAVLFKRQSAEEILKQSRRTLDTNTCQFCQFKFPCSLERKGQDASNTLKTEYVKSDYNYAN